MQEPQWKHLRLPPGIWARLDDSQRQRLVEIEKMHAERAAEKRRDREAGQAKVREDMAKANWIDPDMQAMRTRLMKALDKNGERIPAPGSASRSWSGYPVPLPGQGHRGVCRPTSSCKNSPRGTAACCCVVGLLPSQSSSTLGQG